MLGIGRVSRIAGLVQGRLDDEVADLVGRGGTADRRMALHKQNLAAAARHQRSRRQPAETRADDDDVISLGHAIRYHNVMTKLWPTRLGAPRSSPGDWPGSRAPAGGGLVS